MAMKSGKAHLIFPLDVADADEARRLVRQMDGHVGMFKIGLELFIRTGPGLVNWINEHADAGIFLDLKLHDIPTTVRRAMEGVADLNVDLTTVHCGESRAMLEAAVAGSRGRVTVLGVTVLTSVSATDLAAMGCIAIGGGEDELKGLVARKAAMAKAAGLSGIVCSGHEVAAIKADLGNDFLTVTPGIRPDWVEGKHDDQQRVMTPAEAVATGSDYLVIGRPIRYARDPVAAAQRIAREIDAAIASG